MVDAGTFIYYNAYELLRYSVTLAIIKIFGFANLFCKLLHYTKKPRRPFYYSLRGETSSFRGTTRIQSISGSLYGYNVNQRANLPVCLLQTLRMPAPERSHTQSLMTALSVGDALFLSRSLG